MSVAICNATNIGSFYQSNVLCELLFSYNTVFLYLKLYKANESCFNYQISRR